jgi:DNA polymerase-3 subunit alpha
MSGFAHLHVHTQYSILDGASSITALAEKVKSLGMEAIAITDHGHIYLTTDNR